MSLGQAFVESATQNADALALSDGSVRLTYGDLQERAAAVAGCLVARGLQPGDRLLTLLTNRWETATLYWACQMSGVVFTPFNWRATAEEVAIILADSEAKLVICEHITASAAPADSINIDDDFSELSASEPLATPVEVATEDPCLMLYTSGTTGPPKGAMISHHNLIYQAVNFTPLLPAEPGDDRLSFLPLCHIAERGMAYISLYARITTNFAESVDTVAEDLREVQPRAVVAVPRIWEKFYSAITIAVGDATWLQKLAYGKAIEVGLAAVERELEGQKVPLGLRIKRKLAYWLVLKNIRRMIGVDRCKWLATGAAPIAPDLIKWYLALGLPMLEAYGQTESAGIATLATPDAIKLGTVGRTVPHAEIRISDEGEILIGGDIVFMGYYRNPEKTAETIRDGWLHTGDVGSLDNQGYVRIIDRMKDIIITAGGKNITPSEIENQLKFSPYISDAVVIGDGRKFLSCLIMIDHDTVVKYAQDNAVPFTNFASLTRALEVVDLINAEVEAVNTKFARVETIKTFRLIDQQLDPEDEELTPTMKLKRSFVSSKYKTLIDEMYQAA